MSVSCNGCGANSLDGYGLNAVIDGGYDSTALNDMTRYAFSLCEACLRKIFATMHCPPTVTDQVTGLNVPYQEDLETAQRTAWHNSPVRENKVKHGICNASETCTRMLAGRLVFVSPQCVRISDDYPCEEHMSEDSILVPISVFVPNDPIERLERWLRFYPAGAAGQIVRNDFVSPLFYTEAGDNIPNSPIPKYGVQVQFRWGGQSPDDFASLFEMPTHTGTLYVGFPR